MRLKDIFNLLKTTFKEWSEDKVPRLAAALAYYTAFSIAPLLVIVIGIAGLVWGREAAQGAIVEQIGGLIGADAAQTIQEMIQNVNQQGTSLLATIIGLVTLLLGASGVFGQLQEAMNTMWEVKPKPNLGVMAVIKKRIFSFGMVVVIGFLLLVSLAVTAALAALGNWMRGWLPGGDIVFQIINFLVSFAVITFLFALVYKYVPDAKIAWGDVWLGAAVTSLLFTLGRMAIGLYLGNSDIGSTFGAAGSFILILVWVYYSAQILFFGAEFTQVYANQYGSRIVPEEHAEKVTEEERAEQGIPRKEGGEPSRPQREPAQQPGFTLAGGVPVTGPVTGRGMDLPGPVLPLPERMRHDRGRIWEVAIPTLLALVVGVIGSLFIVREQRTLQPVQKVRPPVKAEVEVNVRAKRDQTGPNTNSRRK